MVLKKKALNKKADDDIEDRTELRRDPCRPPHGKTYLTIGQDLYSIQEYLQGQQNATLHWYMRSMVHLHPSGSTEPDDPEVVNGTDTDKDDDDDDGNLYAPSIPPPRFEDEVPAALMVYTDIQKLQGLDVPIDYGTGVEYAEGALRLASPDNNDHLPIGLQIGLWLGGVQGCRDIVSGKLDDNVNRLIYYLGKKCSASKVFLRIGYEFDNPQFGYWTDPQVYKQAFAYIVNKCQTKRACRRRVVMVWHSWAAGLPGNTTLADFYPGDDLVDWIGISVFQQFYSNDVGGTVPDLRGVLNFAGHHQKPTMIAESTPFGGILHNPNVVDGADIWTAWFQPTINLIKEYDIGMWSYINCNWDVQPQWTNVGFGDTRLSIDERVMDQWYKHVTGTRKFVRATDYRLCDSDDKDDDDDDDYSYRKSHNNKRRYNDASSRKVSHVQMRDDTKGKWFWGNKRLGGGEEVWDAVLPLVMLSSSLAIVLFMFFTTRRRYRRSQRTPRAQRIRFAFLDSMEADDDGSTALYGSIGSNDGSEGWKRSVRRVSQNLLVANTSDGTTIVA